MKKIISAVLAVSILLSLGGCGWFIPSSRENHIMEIHGSRGSYYYFYDKASIEIYSNEAIQEANLGSKPDTFLLKLDDEVYHPILNEYFEKIAVFEGEIMMKSKDQYYVFNVEDYEVKTTDEIEQVENDIIILSNSEFSEKYPNQESIDWKDTERSRQIHSR